MDYDVNPHNLLFFAARDFDLGDRRVADGAGVFSRYGDSLRPTQQGGTPTQWQLPRWFAPEGESDGLSNMGDAEWMRRGNWAYVQRLGPGQEFVLDLDNLSSDGQRQAKRWMTSLCGERFTA